MEKNNSYFDRIFNRPRTNLTIFIVSLVFLLIPFGAALIDGSLAQLIGDGEWRKVLSPPAIILYIWIISPLMTRAGNNVIASLKPLVQLDDDEFHAVVAAAERVKPRNELVSVAIGILIGLAAIYNSQIQPDFSWVRTFWLISTVAMYGILAWTIFIAISSTRVNTALHELPLKIDILDTSPFEPVGRQSLLLALVFIGGITLSLVFTYDPAQFSSLEFWISNLLLVMFTIAIFFISMRPTHLVLADEKKRTLEPVTERINRDFRGLMAELEKEKNPGDLPEKLTALVAYEKRLMAASTWPYTLTILRTLFFSVFIPLASMLARVAVDLFFP